MPKAARYFLGLGSNLGDRRKNLTRAVALLEKAGIRVRRASSIYRTEPKGFAGQPWFYNQVLETKSDLPAAGLLDVAQSIEKAMRRKRTLRNGPRRIDIDILLASGQAVRTRRLTVPHPRLHLRNFVLVPLREIAPRVVHPALGRTMRTLADESRDRSIVEKLD